MVTDVTYHVAEASGIPVINLYGTKAQTGTEVVVQITDFRPYFYVHLPFAATPHRLRTELQKHVDCPILAVDEVQKYPLFGYRPGKPLLMHRITLLDPRKVRNARKSLDYGVVFEGTPCKTYEANIDFALRFMIDVGFGGCSWLELDRCIRMGATGHRYSAITSDIRVRDDIDEIAPVRWLAFDIEACRDPSASSYKGFVDPTRPEDQVTQIALCLHTATGDVIDWRVLCLVPPNGTQRVLLLAEEGDDDDNRNRIVIEEFTQEEQMLLRFRDYIVARDPSVFTGYNIEGFDWPFLFGRAETLGILDQFSQFTRAPERKCRASIKESTFTSKAYGSRTSYSLHCEGRWNFDMYHYIVRNLKLRSYKLGSVASDRLGDTKAEMPYRQIPIYQYFGTDLQRGHLAYYCWKDAHLIFRLIEDRKSVV